MRVDEIKQGCDKYNLKYEDYFGDIKIKSKFDTWLLHEKGNGKLVIYHFNKFTNSNHRGQYEYNYHKQREIDDGINHALKYISNHDNKYIFPTRSAIHAQKMFAMA